MAFAHLGSNRRQGLVLMAVARKERKKQGVYCVLGSQVNGTFSGEPRNRGKKVAMHHCRQYSIIDS